MTVASTRSLARWLLVPLVCGGLAPAALAESPRYSYFTAAWTNTEIDGEDLGSDPEGDGLSIGGSIAVTDMFHLFAEYDDSDLDVDGVPFGFDVDVGYQTLVIGGGANFGVSDTVDIVAQLAYVDVELTVDVAGFGSGSEDESGYGLGAGVRAMVTDDFELNAGVNFVDLGDDADDTTFSLGAVYNFTPVFAVQGGLSFSDDVSSYGVGVRLYFGDR